MAAHGVCEDCFRSFAETSLSAGQFRLDVIRGLTLPCPVIACQGAIADPHHFRLVGERFYQR